MSFLKAMLEVRRSEGFYACDPQDPGGETYMGVARKFFPKWKGWMIVDAVKREHGGKLKVNYRIRNNDLEILVKNFYLKYFWKPLKCDRINNQILQEHLFDCGINLGKKSAVKFIQECCNNTATKNQKILVDGLIGPITLSKINLKRKEFANFIVKSRIDLYFEKCKAKPYKFKYLKGWCLRSLKYLQKA